MPSVPVVAVTGVIGTPLASVPVTVTAAFASGVDAPPGVAAAAETVPEKLGGVGTTVKATNVWVPGVTTTDFAGAAAVVGLPFAFTGPMAVTE